MFQQFGAESSSVVLIFYLFLGFCGLFLFILLISIVLFSHSLDEEEILVDDEEEDEHGGGDDVENHQNSVKVVRQRRHRETGLVYKTRPFIFSLTEVFYKFVRLPVFLCCYCVQCTSEINNDFITIE